MKKALGVLSLSLYVSLAHARPITCHGKVPNSGPSVAVQANWVSLALLQNVNVITSAPVKYSLKSVAADQNYQPRSPMYRGLNRFNIGGDGWSFNYLLLPAVAPSTAEFVGYYVSTGHSGEGTARLLCQ